MRMSVTLGTALLAVRLLSPTPEKSDGPISVGGLSEFPKELRAGDNLVKNTSFEEIDETGAPKEWQVPSSKHFFLTDAVAHTGSRSLVLRNSHEDRREPAVVQPIELVAGWYRLSAWVKAQEAGTNQAGSGGRVMLRWKDAWATTAAVRGTTDWIEMEKNMFPVPGGPAQIRLAGYRKPNGTVSFDDIVLQRLVPPLVEGFVLFPNYRGVLFADGPQVIRVSVSLRPEEADMEFADLVIELSLRREGEGQPRLVEQTLPQQADFIMELDVSDLPTGSYDLNLRALRRNDRAEVHAHPSYRIVKLPAESRRRFEVRVDTDNVLVLGGSRKFVLGIYDTTGYSNDARRYEERISRLSEAPLNLYINYWLGRAPNPALAGLARTLKEHGLYYLHTVNSWYEDNKRWPLFPECGSRPVEALGQNGYAACRAQELGEIPGIAGWYTADEQSADRAPRVFEQYKVLRESDPAGITFIAQNKIRELRRWRDAADVFDSHQYPIFNVPEGTLSPLEKVFEHSRAAVEAVEGSRPVWAVIQYFQHGAKGHWPGYDELRSMSYMAIVAGAKGLIYWSYGAKGLSWVKEPKRKEELWGRLVNLTKEIQSLEAVLLSPNEPGILAKPPSSGAIHTLGKRVSPERYVIAVNVSSEEVQASFTLSEPTSSLTVVGEDRAITVDSPSFQDRFSPYEVHVYKIFP